jgi:3-hydroxypropanoate dehydrogenase
MSATLNNNPLNNSPLNTLALEQLFLTARTHKTWRDTPVPDSLIHQLYELTVLGPTATNGQHGRFLFLKSPDAKERLKPFLSAGNVEKTMQAPVTVIAAMDIAFYEHSAVFFPHADIKAGFIGKEALIQTAALRNSSLQAAYLILAARALGLDTGPMSGFDNAGVDNAFFAGTTLKSNFLINLGYGDASTLHPRLPRPSFEQFSQIL